MVKQPTPNGKTPKPDLRSLTYRDGARVLVRRFVPPPTPAELIQQRLCSNGHAPGTRMGYCPRCGAPVGSGFG